MTEQFGKGMKKQPSFGLPKKIDEYDIYKGKLVKVNGHDVSSLGFGVLHSVTPEHIYLKPVLIDEYLSLRGKPGYYPRIEEEIPKMIKRASINTIETLREGYLEQIITNSYKIAKEKLKKNSKKKKNQRTR